MQPVAVPPPPAPGFRAYPLDGALLYFHPPTGTHVRVATAATRALRRRAPRVAMFGITNACNLRCAFCSRDVERASRWTVASAAALLQGLAAAGTLEVAFGGGEPLLFPGFGELLAELRATTPLALHLTTNGTLVRDGTWRPLRGLVGMARLSIYEGMRWQAAADVFRAHGQRWGANVLVDASVLPALPARLAELAVRGCHDVSLLSYVGPDPGRQLDAEGDHALARIVADSPLPCRLSVCFGTRVAAPRLIDGLDHQGDCGAGHDFVSITPDQQLAGCSFQDAQLPARTADEVLQAWRLRQAQLAQPSPRPGCARPLAIAAAVAPPSQPPPPIAIWQAFAGNNSGECVLVAKFETVARAEAYVADLIPGWEPDAPYSAAWRQLLAEARVATPAIADEFAYRTSPRELMAIGRTVLALSYDADDAFPELRALAWQRGGAVVPGGVHVHDATSLLAVVRCADAADARGVAAAHGDASGSAVTHGHLVLATVPFAEHSSPAAPATLADARAWLTSLAGERPSAIEIFEGPFTAADLLAVRQRLGVELPHVPRLAAVFWGPESAAQARKLAGSVRGVQVSVASHLVLFEDVPHPRRLAMLAYRRGASCIALSGRVIRIQAQLWFDRPAGRKGTRAPDPPVIELAPLEASLRRALRVDALEVTASRHAWSPGVHVQLDTDAPAFALRALSDEAEARRCRLHLGLGELAPLAWAIRRLISDVS